MTIRVISKVEFDFLSGFGAFAVVDVSFESVVRLLGTNCVVVVVVNGVVDCVDDSLIVVVTFSMEVSLGGICLNRKYLSFRTESISRNLGRNELYLKMPHRLSSSWNNLTLAAPPPTGAVYTKFWC